MIEMRLLDVVPGRQVGLDLLSVQNQMKYAEPKVAILFHSHVSRSVEPSDADRIATGATSWILDQLGILLLDSWIVGPGLEACSFLADPALRGWLQPDIIIERGMA